MRGERTRWLPLAACLFCLLFCVPSGRGAEAASGGARLVVTDLGGRRVEVPRGPTRIVCLGPGTLRQICYLQASDRVVGVEEIEVRWPAGRPYRLAHPELAAINAEPDLEAVLALRPQVLFVSYMEPARADRLAVKAGIPVVLLSTGRFAVFDEILYDSLRLAGRILGKEARAEAVVAYIEAIRADLQRRTEGIPEDRRPTVYVGAVGYKGSHGIEGTLTRYIPLEWVGARNVARGGGTQGYLFVDRERLLGWDPEVIFLDGNGAGLVRRDFERKRDFYLALRAFRQGRVYLLHPYNWYVTNVETALADAYAVGVILYPDRFGDVDPEAEADEIFSFFVGKPVYRQMAETYGRLGAPAEWAGAGRVPGDRRSVGP